MKIKEEYVVFGYKAEINSTYHYRFEKGKNSDKYGWSWRGYLPYYNDCMFPNKEQAIAFANVIAANSGGLFNRRPIVIESDDDNYIRTAWSDENKGKYIIFVIRVPVSYYIGDVWARTLDEIGNDKYTDDKPCQVYRDGYEGLHSYRLYLKREQGKADKWVRDKWQGSFFTPKEAAAISEEFCRRVYDRKPNSSYAWTTKELIRPAEGQEPAFEKGDEVFTLPSECWPYSCCRKGRKYVVVDIKVEMDANGSKEFLYQVDGYGDFYPQSCFFTKEQIKADGGRFYIGWFNGRKEELLDYKGHTYTAY